LSKLLKSFCFVENVLLWGVVAFDPVETCFWRCRRSGGAEARTFFSALRRASGFSCFTNRCYSVVMISGALRLSVKQRA